MIIVKIMNNKEVIFIYKILLQKKRKNLISFSLDLHGLQYGMSHNLVDEFR